jgi:sigma-B regulation protein RsbU (phosphoserine phosphatase)
MQNPSSKATPLTPVGVMRRLPTGLAGAAFWLGIWFCVLFLGRYVSGGFGTFLGVLQIFVGIALVSVAIPLLWRLVRKHMLWSLRNKLALTYLLISLTPVVLLLILAAIFAYVAAGQFSIHLAESRLQAEVSLMTGENEHRTLLVSPALERRLSGDNNSQPAIAEALRDTERPAGLDLPRLKFRREVQGFLNGVPISLTPAFDAANRDRMSFGLPPWATELPGGQFSGMVLDGSELYLVAIHQDRWKDGRIFSLMNRLPVEGPVLNSIAEGLGEASLLPETTTGNSDETGLRPPDIGNNQSGQSSPANQSGLTNPKPSSSPTLPSVQKNASRTPGTATRRTWIVGGTEPAPVNVADLLVRFTSTEPVINWDTGQRNNILIAVRSRPSLLYNQLFGASLGGIITSALRIGLFILCLLFAIVAILAVWMALRLSRTITSSVTDLYKATQHIDRGDLNYRIGVTNADQLAELSRSFNTMTGSLQRLLQEQKEKERLQSEISIAQEVQANLFPLHARGVAKLDLHGVCRPARSVSGDYYDFLVFHDQTNGPASRRETGVGIAIGDISGKGISAALLMATLHSAVRAYRFASEELVFSESPIAGLTASRESSADKYDELFQSPGRILSLLNRHLYRSTQPEKYATLFLAHYDADSSRLIYSNAGQLPPLVLSRDGSIRRLDQGGTVVGLMDGMHYDEDSFHMQPGDILVGYSDGVTEPENDFGEFGEERLMEVVSRYRDQPLHVISTQVMLALDAWIGADEQPDDITLILARQS